MVDIDKGDVYLYMCWGYIKILSLPYYIGESKKPCFNITS